MPTDFSVYLVATLSQIDGGVEQNLMKWSTRAWNVIRTFTRVFDLFIESGPQYIWGLNGIFNCLLLYFRIFKKKIKYNVYQQFKKMNCGTYFGPNLIKTM